MSLILPVGPPLKNQDFGLAQETFTMNVINMCRGEMRPETNVRKNESEETEHGVLQ